MVTVFLFLGTQCQDDKKLIYLAIYSIWMELLHLALPPPVLLSICLLPELPCLHFLFVISSPSLSLLCLRLILITELLEPPHTSVWQQINLIMILFSFFKLSPNSVLSILTYFLRFPFHSALQTICIFRCWLILEQCDIHYVLDTIFVRIPKVEQRVQIFIMFACSQAKLSSNFNEPDVSTEKSISNFHKILCPYLHQ